MGEESLHVSAREILPYIMGHCNRLQQTATDCNRLQHTSTEPTLQHNATEPTLQHTATEPTAKHYRVATASRLCCSELKCVARCCTVLWLLQLDHGKSMIEDQSVLQCCSRTVGKQRQKMNLCCNIVVGLFVDNDTRSICVALCCSVLQCVSRIVGWQRQVDFLNCKVTSAKEPYVCNIFFCKRDLEI